MAIPITREEYERKFGTPPGGTTSTPTASIQTPKRSVIDTAKDFAGGAVYGISAPGRTVQNLLSKGVDKITGTKDFGKATKEGFEQSTDTDVDTTSGKVGQFAGEVASFAIPGSAAIKAPTMAGKMALSAASDATVQTLQQGEVNRSTLDTAILGAVFPGLGKLASTAKVKIGSASGSRLINSLIKPVSKQFSYGKNPGKIVAEMGITANSLDDLATKISTARNNVGQQLSILAKQVPDNVRINAGEALNSFEEAIQTAVRNNDQSLLNRLNEAKTALTNVMGLKEGKIVPTGTRLLDNLTYDQAREFKKIIGDVTKWTGQQTEDATVNGALTRAYGALKGQMDNVTTKVDPRLAAKLKKLNEAYGNLTSAEVATKYREALAQRSNMIPFGAKTIGAGAGLITGAVTGGITPALIVGLGVAGLDKALATPAFKTRMASWLASASTAEKQGLFKQAPWLRSALQASFFGSEGEEGMNPNNQEK